MRRVVIEKNDRRTRYTRQVIKSTILELLQKEPFGKVTVTQICKQAEINRGTFYLHYYDTYNVLDDIITDVLSDTTSVLDHLLCTNRIACTYPFCEKIQNSKEYQILFFDDVASARLLEKLIELGKEDFVTKLMQNSTLTFQQAEAVFVFQMNGCLAINRQMLKNRCTDWREIQGAIDRFIKSGLETFLVKNE